MRTDSTRIAASAQEEAKEYIIGKYGETFAPESPQLFEEATNAQDAHEAIRPTSILRDPDSIKSFMSRDQFRLYKLIWERFVASQMSSAILDTLSVDIAAGDTIFRAAGSKCVFKDS